MAKNHADVTCFEHAALENADRAILELLRRKRVIADTAGGRPTWTD